jgi:hypothetical protein
LLKRAIIRVFGRGVRRRSGVEHPGGGQQLELEEEGGQQLGSEEEGEQQLFHKRKGSS